MIGTPSSSLSSLFLGLVLVVVAVTPSLGRSVLVSVGINDYDPGLSISPLFGCVADAQSIRDNASNYPELWEERELYTNNTATESAVRTRMTSLASELVAGDTLWYYQASHGSAIPTTGSTYSVLIMYDGAYTDQEMANDLSMFDAGVQIVVVVDACFSGGLFKSGGGSVAEWNFGGRVAAHLEFIRLQEAIDEGLKATMPSNVGFITAVDEDQSSLEIDGHGLFTSHFVDAFNNGDDNADGEVNFLEAFNYAAPRTTSEAAGEGEPMEPQKHNDGVLQSVVMRAFALSDLKKTLSSGCAVDNHYDGPHGPLLYLPVLTVLIMLCSLRLRRYRRQVQLEAALARSIC